MPTTVDAYPTPPQSPSPTTPLFVAESRIGTFLGGSLELTDILGTGAYGVVYRAFDHNTKTQYAVKALSKTNSNGEVLDHRQRNFQKREIQYHYEASAHPNIVSMYKIVDQPDCAYVIIEYCPEGDLFSNITEKGRFVGDDAAVKSAFLQILAAVDHCHRLRTYHRDLKPENILVSQSGSKVLLADFGLATKDIESDDHGCGSTFYMSPECLDQSSRSASYRCAPNDVWSLGVILVNLTCGRNPWKQASTEDSTYRAFTRDSNFLKTILPLSDELNRILGRIFEKDPEQRITVQELIHEIEHCQSFSMQSQVQLPLSPPTSPEFLPQKSDYDMSISSSEGSEASLTSSGSDSDSDVDSDSGSDLTEPDHEPFEIIDGQQINSKRVTAPAQVLAPQTYVIHQDFPPSCHQPQQHSIHASTQPAVQQQQWSAPPPTQKATWYQPWGTCYQEPQYEPRVYYSSSPVQYVSSFVQPAFWQYATAVPHHWPSW